MKESISLDDSPSILASLYSEGQWALLILVNWCTCTTKDNLKEKTMIHQVRNLHFFQITTYIKKWVSVGIMFKWNEWLLNSGKVFLSLMETHVQALNNLHFKRSCSAILTLMTGYSRLTNILYVIDFRKNICVLVFKKNMTLYKTYFKH